MAAPLVVLHAISIGRGERPASTASSSKSIVLRESRRLGLAPLLIDGGFSRRDDVPQMIAIGQHESRKFGSAPHVRHLVHNSERQTPAVILTLMAK